MKSSVDVIDGFTFVNWERDTAFEFPTTAKGGRQYTTTGVLLTPSPLLRTIVINPITPNVINSVNIHIPLGAVDDFIRELQAIREDMMSSIL